MPKRINAEKTTYRTAIYCRLSKDDGNKGLSNSIEGQIAYCTNFIEGQKDLKLAYQPFCDDGYTGLNLNRPDFQKMDKLIQAGKIDCIVCRDLSRLTRDYVDGGEYLENILPHRGVRLIAINYCDTKTDDPQSIAFLLPLLNLFNDSYSRDTSIKIRSSLSVKRERGDYVGASYPLGYQKSPENRNKLIPDGKSVGTVQKIFSLFKDGFSIPQIAMELNRLEIPTPLEYKHSQGGTGQDNFKTKEISKWEYNTVRRILTNEVYIGVLVQGKSTTKNYKVKQVEKTPISKRITVENAHEPIIPLHDFMAVQEKLRRNTRCSPDGAVKNLLSGFIFCADCGATMVRKSMKTNGKTYYYYICSNHKNTKTCSTHNINCNEVEENVLEAIHDQIEIALDMDSVMERIGTMPDGYHKGFSYQEEINKLEQEIEKYKAVKLGLYTDLKSQIITKQEYEQFRDEYTGIIEEKQRQRDKLEHTKKQAEITGTGTKNWIQLFRDHESAEEVDHRILMELVDKVLIHENHGIEIVFQYKDVFADTLEKISSHSKENNMLKGGAQYG